MTVDLDTGRSQMMAALARANEKRQAAAAFKRDIHALGPRLGAQAAADFLRDPDPDIDCIHVDALLLAVCKLGQVQAERMLVNARVGPIRTRHSVYHLTPRQRRALADQLDVFAERRQA